MRGGPNMMQGQKAKDFKGTMKQLAWLFGRLQMDYSLRMDT